MPGCGQYRLWRGLKTVLGSLSLSRSRWLLGDKGSLGRAAGRGLSLLKRSRPLLRSCSSILRWRLISERTLSIRASRRTVDRAEEPGKSGIRKRRVMILLTVVLKCACLKGLIILWAIPGVLRRLMKAFLGVCSSSKSNSVGVRLLQRKKESESYQGSTKAL